mgnify:CR=1 FL=1
MKKNTVAKAEVVDDEVRVTFSGRNDDLALMMAALVEGFCDLNAQDDKKGLMVAYNFLLHVLAAVKPRLEKRYGAEIALLNDIGVSEEDESGGEESESGDALLKKAAEAVAEYLKHRTGKEKKENG